MSKLDPAMMEPVLRTWMMMERASALSSQIEFFSAIQILSGHLKRNEFIYAETEHHETPQEPAAIHG